MERGWASISAPLLQIECAKSILQGTHIDQKMDWACFQDCYFIMTSQLLCAVAKILITIIKMRQRGTGCQVFYVASCWAREPNLYLSHHKAGAVSTTCFPHRTTLTSPFCKQRSSTSRSIFLLFQEKKLYTFLPCDPYRRHSFATCTLLGQKSGLAEVLLLSGHSSGASLK